MVTYLLVVTMLIFSGLSFYVGYKVGSGMVKTEYRYEEPEEFLDPVYPEDDYEQV